MEQIFINIFFNVATTIAANLLVPIIGLFVVFKIMGGILFDRGR